MTIQPAVKQETLKIAAGTALLACVMVLVFILVGHFDLSVLWGALLGVLCAVGNFFLMALSVQQAAERMNGAKVAPLPEDESEEEPPLSEEAKRARQRMQLSYTGRMLLLAGIAIVAVLVPGINALAAILCLLFPRMVIFAEGILMNRKPKKEA